jgi:hypothetical protein
MVIGLFDNPNHAAVCLSNLLEADFPPHDISVVTSDPRRAAALATVSGPLSGVDPDDLIKRLVTLGLSPNDAEPYRVGLRQGNVLIAVSTAGADDAAAETLRDHQATAIRVL